jgi:lantibiotic modifying enzyme
MARRFREGAFLGGFSHGAGGIGWALLRLSAASGRPHFAEAGRRAIAYDRSLFDASTANWRDLRKDTHENAAGRTYWCHGAAGIGLGRLGTLDLIDDDATRAEIGTALTTTLRSGFRGNHCLCHGDLGNLELLSLAARHLGGPDVHQPLHRVLSNVLEDIASAGWRCGVPLGAETPGLMTGLAGIGFGLLRAARGDQVPSVLLLEPPMTPADTIG